MTQDIFVIIEHVRGQIAEISYVMLAGARQAAKASGGQVVAVLVGHEAQALVDKPSSESGKYLAADKVIMLDHPALKDFSSDAWQKALAELLGKEMPRLVVFGSTTIGTDLAGSLSGRMGLPLVSSCRTFGEDGKFISQICGGKIMAEGDLPQPAALATMVPGGYKTEQGQADQPPAITKADLASLDPLRVSLVNYIEPASGDVDIAREGVLVSVGRGIQNQDNISLAEDLAQALGGVVSGSRPVIDQGWLQTSRLVGKSGKHVNPKIYLALGISGAPEHAEAITDAGAIIAINTDPAAPIFNIAKYGAEIDMFDLLEVLTTQVKAAKGG